MSSNNIFDPMIRELEELARQHPDPKVRAEVMHLIDLMSGVCDQSMMELMHQFYHLREQLREQREIKRLQNQGKETQVLPFDFSAHFDEIPEPTEETRLSTDTFQDVIDEIEVDEMMLAHRRWHVTIGEA